MVAKKDYSDLVDSRQQAVELQAVMPQSKIIAPVFWATPSPAMPVAIRPEQELPTQARAGTTRPYYPFIKRGLDVVVALVLLLVLSPILAIIAITIKLTSPGNAVFRQVRVGKDMQLFTCYKFRSMVSNAEWILQENQALQAAYVVNWKMKRDPRVTKIGRLIRKTSLDELLQLVNVIRGEMSLIGPRPYMPKELGDEFGVHAGQITQVRPGMTGLWQVSGRSTLTPHQRIELDKRYACDVSVVSDIRIMLKTVKVVIISFGAC